MGVVICGSGRLRPRPTPTPTICSEAKSRLGRWLGAPLRAPPPTSPPTPTLLEQMSPIDELKVRSTPPPRLGRPRHREGRRRGGRGGRGAVGGGRQGEWGGEPSQAKPSPLLGLRVLSPTRVRPQRGVPDQEPGAWPAGPLPGSRHAPLGRADLEAGAHGPAGVWAMSSWPGLGLELAPGGEGGGRPGRLILITPQPPGLLRPMP